MKKPLHWLFSLALLLAFTLSAGHGQAQPPAPANFCRFGISVATSLTGYDLSILGVGSYLDWGASRNEQVPANIRYFHVVRVSDHAYPQSLANMAGLLAQYPGAVWIIGNEPDSEVDYQDHITAERYAERYFELASLIRRTDPNAMIGFGPVIQSTPLRRFYLELALNRLASLAGSWDNVEALIDVFTIHNFLLNETPIYRYDENGNRVTISWGAGVPEGYQAGIWPEPYAINIGGANDETWKTHDAELFAERIKDFRVWMNSMGMREKPLWITEFGSLFPSDSRGGLLTVSQADTADFLQKTFDYLLTAADATTGYTADGNRLVQHFTWFSLNEALWRFGGALYNPDDRKLTMIGERFINYDPPAAAEAAGLLRQPSDLYFPPNSLVIIPLSAGSSPSLVNYKVMMRAGNQIASEYHTQARIDLSVNGTLASQQDLNLPRCGGQSAVTFTLTNQKPGDTISLSALLTLLRGNGPETDSSNNSVTFRPHTLPALHQIYNPLIYR